MKDWPQDHIDHAGIALRYFRSGGDRPPLVLVHGYTDNALYFTRLADHLAAEWDVVAYDGRGHGATPWDGKRFSDTERVDDLVAVITMLELDRPALVGHSMGAAAIGFAVAAHPGISRGLVLEDPAWWDAPGASDDTEAVATGTRLSAEQSAWRDSLAALHDMTPTERIAWRRADSPQWTDDDVDLSIAARLEMDLGIFDEFRLRGDRWQDAVGGLDCPSLLLTGENALGAIVSPTLAATAATLNPQVRWHHVAGAGHAVRYDRFDEYLAAVDPFLDELR